MCGGSDGHINIEWVTEKHFPCQEIQKGAPDMLKAASQMDSLKLTGIVAPYSMATITVSEDETDETALAKLMSKLFAVMRPHQLYNATKDFSPMTTAELTKISEKDAKKEFMSVFFYDDYKYICVNNREQKRDKGIEEDYLNEVQTIYWAFFNTYEKLPSLQTQCIAVIRKTRGIQKGKISLFDEASKTKKKENKPVYDKVEIKTNNSERNNCATDIPKHIQAHVDGLTYYYESDICAGNSNDWMDLDSDDMLIVINRPRAMAVGLYCYYSRFHDCML